jgi:hypothetical protein
MNSAARRTAGWNGTLAASCNCFPPDARDSGTELRCERCGSPYAPRFMASTPVPSPRPLADTSRGVQASVASADRPAPADASTTLPRPGKDEGPSNPLSEANR